MDASPQSSLSKAIGGVGAPRFIGDTNPVTGDFYMVNFVTISQIGPEYVGNAANVTGQSFPAGFVLGGQHTIIQLNSGSAVIYGSQS